MKTAGVKALVHRALDSIPQPYTAHVIDDLLFAIENDSVWLRQYHALCDELGQPVVNAWCGQWTAHAVGKCGQKQVSNRKNSLTNSYSLLDADAPVVTRKPTEAEALQMLADYFKAKRAELPKDIPKHRDEIIALLMDGIPVEEAFLLVQLTGKN